PARARHFFCRRALPPRRRPAPRPCRSVPRRREVEHVELAAGLSHERRQVGEPTSVLELDRVGPEPDPPVLTLPAQRGTLRGWRLALGGKEWGRQLGDALAEPR